MFKNKERCTGPMALCHGAREDVLQEASTLKVRSTTLLAMVAGNGNKFVVAVLGALRDLTVVDIDLGLHLLTQIVAKDSSDPLD